MARRNGSLGDFHFANGNEISYEGKSIIMPYESGKMTDPDLKNETVNNYKKLATVVGNEKATRILGVPSSTIDRWDGESAKPIHLATMATMASCQGITLTDLVRSPELKSLARDTDEQFRNGLGWIPSIANFLTLQKHFPEYRWRATKSYTEYLDIRLKGTLLGIEYWCFVASLNGGRLDLELFEPCNKANKASFELTRDHDITRSRYKHFNLHYLQTPQPILPLVRDALYFTIIKRGADEWNDDKQVLEYVDHDHERHRHQIKLYLGLPNTKEELIKSLIDRYTEIRIYKTN